MTCDDARNITLRQTRKSFSLVILMLLFSVSPLLSSPIITAHDSQSLYNVWDKTGTNDTGWVLLEATGADPATGQPAYADWNLDFAPGAEIANLTFEVQVNGSAGVSIDEPKLFPVNTGDLLFDYGGYGTFGQSQEFDAGNPHSGRLSPNTDSNAVWTLPAGAEIDSLIFEALAPVDPVVSFTPFEIDVIDTAHHPTDGRTYMALENVILLIDANTDPHLIDLIEPQNDEYWGITDLEIDDANDRILIATMDGIKSFSLLDGSDLGELPDNPYPDAPLQFVNVNGGDLWGVSTEGLFKLNSAGSGWTQERIAGTTGWPAGEPEATHLLNSVLYVSIYDEGVARWDMTSGQTLTTWSTINWLPSDRVRSFAVEGTRLLMPTEDAGVARYDYSGQFWLGTWNTGNGLASNDVHGVVVANNMVFILSGSSMQEYDPVMGSMGSPVAISTFGLPRDGLDVFLWPSMGERSPSVPWVMVSDGTGDFIALDTSGQSWSWTSILLASGPSGFDMSDVIQVGQVVWVAVGDNIDRFDLTAYQWLSPIALGETATKLSSAGNTIWVGTEEGGLIEIDGATASINNTITTNDGLNSDEINGVAVRVTAASTDVVVTHPSDGVSVVSYQSGTMAVPYTFGESDGFNFMRGVAIGGDIAYLATDGDGLGRLNLSSGNLLTSWTSTGVDDVDYAPVELAGDVLLMGLYGHGVVRKDLATGEFLDTWTSGSNALPDNDVMSLHKDAYGNIWIGTDDGLARWDGSNFNQATGGGWNGPSTYYSLVSDSTYVYAGTNTGVCAYSISNAQLDDCWTTQDGMPYNYVRSISIVGDIVMGGTWLGVGLINTTSGSVVGTWEAGGQTDNAVVEIMDDIAYIALSGMGVARFDLTTGNWLDMWQDGSGGLLDTDGITSLAADRFPNRLWVGGDDGFQLLDVINETELYDIEKSSSLFSGNGDPIEIVISGNVMYYISYFNYGDNVHRIDLDNFSGLSSLDAGSQVGINGYAYGIGLVNGILNIGVSEWGDGDGAVARYDTINKQWDTTWEATGTVDRVTTYESSATGNYWVAWGEVSLNEYSSSGVLLNSWDSLDWPIREIVEYDGELLFATTDGVARYDESANQWLSTWTPGNGLPTSAEDQVYDLFVDGTDLWVGTGATNWWGNPSNPRVSLLDGSGSWSTWNGGQNSIPNGFPISFTLCDGIVHVAMSNSNNGGIARYDGSSWLNAYTQNGGDLSDGSPDAVACDDMDTLYIGYYDNDVGIDRYSYSSGQWLSTLDNSNSGISDDGLWWDSMSWENGQLVLGHKDGTTGSGNNQQTSYGGFSILSARGVSFGQANVINQGAAVTDVDFLSTGWHISTAGSESGYSHIDTLNQNGLNLFLALPGLVNGRVIEMIGNSTHVWAVTADSFAQGQGVLQGLLLPNGSVEWQRGWSSFGGDINEIILDGEILYVSISGRGLAQYNTVTGAANFVPQGLNEYTDGLAIYGDEIVVGLQGTWASAAGVEVWNTTTNQWSMGRLLSGLPNNIINDFAVTSSHVMIATEGGIGMWNITKNDWDDPLTSIDGLASNNVKTFDYDFSTDVAYMGTPIGIARWNFSSGTPLATIDRGDGLVGDWTVSTITSVSSSGSVTLYASHNGAGNTRPGVSQFDLPFPSMIQTHRPDQIPHNTVTAVATDWWGVHIATVGDPLTHWNASSGQFEDGAATWQLPAWPVYDMDSDGSTLFVTGDMGGARVEIGTPTHAVLDHYPAEGALAVCVSSSGMWMVTAYDGLLGWGPAPTFEERETWYLRRAEPLNIGFAGIYENVSGWAHPGQSISFIGENNPVTLDSTIGVPGPGGILMQGSSLVISSPVEGAATWVKSHHLNYSGIWDLNQTNPNLMTDLQEAIDGGALVNGSRQIQLRLQSFENGSMWVRITYDWVRTETPVEMVDLWDRPDDGGGALIANWTMVHDDSFSRYVVFLHEGAWINAPTTSSDLANLVPDASISLHSRTQTEIVTAGGSPIIDGQEYWAIVAVEYAGGFFGTPSAPFGPANSSDEIPNSPDWGEAMPNAGGEIGELYVEWSRCTSLDLASTNIYYSTTMITDAIALPMHSGVDPSDGNTTIIDLPAGIPYWLALTCVDEAGQENLSDALIIGPVVPTGGLNDGIPPPKINGVWAEDVDPDEGGRVEVGWDISIADDCAFYTIYVLEGNSNIPVNDEGVPENVDDFLAVEVIPDCSVNGTIISLYNGIPLTDGQPYWIGVVASDDWLNEDKGNVDIVTATPFRNLFDSNIAPNRIGSIEAWDTPDDDGTAVDVRWTPSNADDFAYYIIWAGEFDMSNLDQAWEEFGPNPSACACLRVDKQWIVDETTPIEVTIENALYPNADSVGPEDGLVNDIKPDVTINVTVTVHDIKGNVETTQLTTAEVTPIDNSQDYEAPRRIASVELSDFPQDDGTRLLLEFTKSDASDLDYYEIYASTSPFTSVGASGNGPMVPLMTLDRSHSQPITLDALLQGDPILPNVPITVAVVAYDTNGNVHLDGLLTDTESAIDNGISDPGSYLPDILGVNAEWDDYGEGILVTWMHTTDPQVESYRIWIGDESFSESGVVSDATMVGMESSENSFRISAQSFEDLDNKTSWWIGISAVDSMTFRHEISTIEVVPFNSTGTGDSAGDSAATAKDEKSFLDEIMEPTNLLIAALLFAILVVLIMLVRGNGGRSRRDSMWELQEATWGISDGNWDSDVDPMARRTVQVPSSPPPEMAANVYSAAANIQQKSAPDIPQQRFSQQPQQQPQQSQEKESSGIDTSFLDDLL